jgi:putative methionine-R-sulfoxide reductase with GAF domain
MKSILQKSNYVLATLFAIGVLYSGYILYRLPAELEKVSGRIDLLAINEAQPVLNRSYLIIGLTLFVGIVALMRLLFDLSNLKKTSISQTARDKTEDAQQQDSREQKEMGEDNLLKQAKEIISGSQKIKSEKERYDKLLSGICKKIEASQAVYYKVKKDKSKRYIEMLSSFAFNLPESETLRYEFGEGLAGQVAKEGKSVNIDNVPEGYINIISGLGSASPNHLVICPLRSGRDVVAVAEIASFKEITAEDEKLISEVLKLEEERNNSKPVRKMQKSKESTARQPEDQKKQK